MTYGNGGCNNPPLVTSPPPLPTIPSFTQLGPYCVGQTPGTLPAISNNGITGTWSPATISTATSGSTVYTFTPSVGQCATNQTMTIVVNTNTTPTFTQLGPYCVGQTPGTLPAISNNGITGTWSPATISTATSGSTVYTFTPDVGQCGTSQTMTIVVNTNTTPTFTQLGPYCVGQTPGTLPAISNNGITGTWSPATISTATSGSTVYTFTPDVGQCGTSQTMTIVVNTNTTPTFTQLGPYCVGQTPGTLPAISNNGITGTWSPATISTATSGSTVYTFTPDVGQCGTSQTMTIVVNTNTTPTFTQLGPYCVGQTPGTLPAISSNGITGTWSPATISTATSGSTVYTFTPSVGQCATNQTMTIVVNTNITPTFTQLGPYCVGQTPGTLPAVSNNGITGTWSPATISTATSGSTVYTFTPDAGQCATNQTMTIVVNTNTTPTFTQLGPYCVGQTPGTLPAISSNGITGTWSPATISTATSGSTVYTFTPDAGQCGTSQTMTIVVNANTTPTFTQLGPYCVGQTPGTLPAVSNNGITGTWSPATISTATSGSTVYTFTPDAGQCATSQTMTIVVNANTTPTFTQLGPYCVGQTPGTLPAISNNGITGTWSPAVVSTATPGTTTYTFTSSAGQCANNGSMNISVNANPVANPPQPLQFCVLLFPPTLLSENVNAVLNQIVGGQSGLTVNWFFDAAATQPITNINNVYLLIPPPGTVYVNVSNGTCTSSTVPVNVVITQPPILNNPGNQTACQSYTLPPITGSNLPGNQAYFTGPNGTGAQFLPGQTITSTTTLYIYAGSGLCSDQEQFTITITQPPTANSPGTPLQACDNGAGVGLFNLTSLNNFISGGPGTVSWWTNPAATNPIANPAGYTSGTATVYATVSNGTCSSVAVPVSLQVLPSPTANAAGPLQACNNGSGQGVFPLTNLNGIISGGTGVVNWYVDPGGSLLIPNPNSYLSTATTVYAIVTAGGCSAQPVPVSLQLLPQPVATPPASPFQLCATSGSTATFNLTTLNGVISGGTGTVNWWTNSVGTLPINTPNAYVSSSATVYASVSNGVCSSTTVPVSLLVNPNPVVNLSIAQPISCASSANGAISTTVSGASAPFNFDWNVNPLDGIQNPSNLPAGTYAVTVTATGTGCSGTASITLTAPTSISLSCAQQSPVSTVGGSNGVGTVQISGGTPGYTVAWSGAASGTQNQAAAGTATLSGLVAGTYTVTVTDANGCTQTCSFTINSPSCNLTVSASGSNPTCAGASTGSITLTVGNATGSLTFDWNVNALDGTQNPTGLGAGTYSVTVTDGAGCQASTSVTLSAPSAIVLSCAQQSPVSTVGGSNGVGTVQISGGTPGYTVAWSGAASGTQTQAAAGTATLSGLVAGTYTVTVTDANSCTQTCSFTINSPSCNLTVSAVGSNPTCAGASTGSITLTVGNATGSLTFDWNVNALDGTQNPAGLGAGTYSVTVTDGAGCQASTSVTLSAPPAIVLSCAQQSPVSTVGGSNGVGTVQISGGTPGYTVAWSGAASGTQNQAAAGTATLSGLVAGTYTVTVTDANSCTQTCSFTINSPSCNLTVSAVGSNPTCAGASTGSITLTVGNATGSLTFDWNVNALDGTQNPTGLGAGTYSVTVTDGAGCQASTSVTLSAPSAIVLSCAQQSPVSTVGGSNGVGTVQISGGTPGYTVAWSGAASGTQTQAAAGTATLSGLVAGTYTVTVTDANGCTQTCSFTINSPSCNLTVSAVGSNPTCAGASTGSITLTVGNATGSLTFDWNVNALDGTQNPAGLGAGTYSVTVTDGAGCQASTSVTLSAPSAIVLSCAQQSPVSTVGGSNGVGTVQISGGTPGYTVAWSGAASGTQNQAAAGTATLSGLVAGTYTVTVTDANGCTQTCSFTINSPSCNLTVSASGSNPTCAGASTGSITLTVGNATGSLTFDWNVNALDGTQNPTGLGAGTYSVTVTDGAGCQASTSVTLSAPSAIVLSCAQQSPVSTVGGSNGVGTVQISGGTPGYTVAWSGAASGTQTQAAAGTATLSGLVAGTYTVTVTDANSCTQTCSFTINSPSCNLTVSAVGSNPTCAGASTGSITLTVGNATGSLTFDWNVNALDGTQNPAGLGAGTYSVTVTDGAGCQASTSVTLSAPSAIVLSCAQQSPVSTVGGSNGVGTVQISGGTPGYTVAWSGAASGTQTQAAAGTATLSGLVAGTYAVTVTDANGCTQTCSFTINSPSCNLTVSAVGSNPTCAGASTGSITLTVGNATGSLTFDWNVNALDGTQNPAGLGAGTYSVTVTDGAGCQASTSVTLSAPSAIVLSCAQQSPVSTVGGSNGVGTVQISGGTPGYTVAWSGAASGTQTQAAVGTATLSGLVAGTYTVTVTDANGCTQTCSFTINSPSCNLTVSAVGSNPTCAGASTGSITLTVGNATGSLTFDWNVNALDGTQNPTGLGAGTYSVTVTDGAGCQASTSVTLSAPPAIVLSCAQQSPVSTVGGSNGVGTVQISGGTPGYTVAWSGAASGTQTQAAAGTATLSGLVAGTYTVTVTDANGCTQTCNFIITPLNCNLLASASVVQPRCAGLATGSIALNIQNAVGALTFDWNVNALDGQQNVGNLNAGVYSVTVTDSRGCQAQVSVTLSAPPALVVLCQQQQPASTRGGNDGAATVQISGGTPFYTVSWSGASPGSTTVNAAGTIPLSSLSAGNYIVLVTDSLGCTQSCNFTIDGPPCNMLVQASATNPRCHNDNNGSIQVEVRNSVGDLNFTWTNTALNGQRNPTGLAPGAYSVTVTDVTGCSAMASVVLTSPQPLAFTASSREPNCAGSASGAVVINSITGGTGPFEASVNGRFFAGIGNLPYALDGLTAGTYTVVVQDANDCEASLQVIVPPGPVYTLDLGPDVFIRSGDSARLEGLVNFSVAGVRWTPTEFLSDTAGLVAFARPTATTAYQLTAFDAKGCKAEDVVFVFVERVSGVYVPTAFSPNEDGINDRLMIFADHRVTQVKTFRVYDRWGDLLFFDAGFAPNDPQYGWDGAFKGRTMNPGVYLYVAEVEYIDGRTELLKGEVTLLR